VRVEMPYLAGRRVQLRSRGRKRTYGQSYLKMIGPRSISEVSYD
jgi:hypothetical protein